jgi:hypothetical protein
MVELGQLSVSIVERESNVVLFSFMEGDYFHTYLGECDEICDSDNNVIIKIGGYGFYQHVVHSLELSDFYRKMNVVSSKCKNLEPSSTDKVYSSCLDMMQSAQQKTNIGFRVSLLEESSIDVTFVIENRQFTLNAEVPYEISVDDKNLIVTSLDSEIPFMDYIIDDVYVDLTALIPIEQSREFLKQIAEGLMDKYGFKITNSYNDEGNEI